MFEKNEVVSDKVDRLFKVCETLVPGDILTHEMIDAVLECERNGDHWKHCMKRLYRRLEAHGIPTLFAHTVGLRLLTPAQAITELPEHRTNKGIRQQRKLRRSLNSLDPKKLTVFQRRQRQFLVDLAKNTEEAMRRALRESQEPIRPTPTIPRRIAIPKPEAAEARA